MARVKFKDRLSVSDVQRTLDRLDEFSPSVLGRSFDIAASVSDTLGNRFSSPEYVLRKPYTSRNALSELNRRFQLNFQRLQDSPDWGRLSPDGFGLGKSKLYSAMASDTLTEFWVENFFRAGVRLFAGSRLSAVTELLTANTDAVLGKAFEVGNFLLEKDLGNPSCDYCFLASGNFGRREWLPNSDVDLWLVWSGPGETTGRPVFTGDRYSESNRRYFSRLFDKVGDLLDRTDIQDFHLRGPFTVEECQKMWAHEPGPVEIRDRRNALNLRPIYSVGGVLDQFQNSMAQRVYNPLWRDHFVSRIIDWKTFENDKAVKTEKKYAKDGCLRLSLNYVPGGNRTLLFLHHIGQIMDESPPSVKVDRPTGVTTGLSALGHLPAGHPFRATAEEVHLMKSGFEGLGLISARIRYKYPEQYGGWDLLDEERIKFLSGELNTPAKGVVPLIRGEMLNPIQRLWEKYVSSFKDSGRYRPWHSDPMEIYAGIHGNNIRVT